MAVREEIMGKRPTPILAIVLFGAILLWRGNPADSLAQHATPETAAPVAITSEILGRAAPATVANPELSLGRVTVMPGAVLPVHYHPGTQIGVVVQGELTYTVFTGEIEWYRGDDPTGEPYAIGPGETVVVHPGDALVESPESIHQGSNNGAIPLVIYLSTLFPTDAPRAIVVEATPVP
ncbi:MAG: Cupin 2, conserved barrel domain protein [Thermomicrobiales bacterium]|jgi:quercetin dioxygenase-like cupin family protein|nr:Cupin 2, conserved barrel domain protein [Thermomicrobiales bacterium]